MKQKILGLLCAFALPFAASAEIVKISVQAPIHPVTSEYIRNSLNAADRDNAPLLIIALNTPGGLDTSMREIIERILKAETPVCVWVSPSGARAASAGFIIGLASDLFIMSPGTNTGAAHPVGLSVTGQAMDKTMEDKVTHDAASYVKSLAERRDRNVQMAEDAVRKSLAYTEKEALQGGLIDGIASSVEDIVGQFDGRTIRRFNGAEVALPLKGQPVKSVEMTSRQRFLLTIANPNLAYLLLMIGLLGLYFEFANPGAILPGVLGAIALLLAFFAFQILPINYVGLLLILLAVALFVLEIKVTSYGILSVGGIVAMIIGSVMLIDSPIPELRPSLKVILPVAVGISLIFIFLVALVIRAIRNKVRTGKEGLVGEEGQAWTAIEPEGKVFVHGEYWRARADEVIPRGAKVRIIEVLDHLTLKVKAIDQK